MGYSKNKKEEEMLTHLAAKYIALEAGRTTLITPMRSDLSPDRKRVTIYVSVFPTEHEEAAVAFLMRHKDQFRNYLKKAARLAVLPYITFEVDFGERNRQRLDELSGEL